MKLIKITLSIILLLLGVCVIAVTSLIIFMDPNKLKPAIVAEVMKKTGYQLVIDGQLSWSFYPRMGVRVEHMILRLPTQLTPFMNLYQVSIATDFMQLLDGRENLQGDIYIGKVDFMQVKANDAHVGLHWQANRLTLEPLTAFLYGGTMEGVAHGSDLSALPHWDWDVQLKQVQLKPLLQDMTGNQSKLILSGVGEVQLRALTTGVTRNQLLANLNGSSHFSLREGILEGIDLNYFVQSADALINKQPLDALINTAKTPFDNLIGEAVIKDGVVDTDNLLLVSSAFSTKTSGRLDLANQTLNYQLQVLPLHAAKIQWAIPLLVTGDLNHPVVRLDTLKLENLLARDQIEKVKDKVQEQIKQLPAKADKFLKKLLGE